MQVKLSLLLVTLFCSIFLIAPRKANADVGVPPTKGGTITTGDKLEEVSMRHESVVFEIREIEKSDSFDEAYIGDYYAHVTAEFEMFNASQADFQQKLFFPIPEVPQIEISQYEEANSFNYTINFEVSVNGKEIDYDNLSYTLTSIDQIDQVFAPTFEVDFEALAETTILVEYDTRIAYEPKSIYGSFHYILHTGSHWKGPIDSGEVIFRFPNQINDAVFIDYNDFFVMEENELRWEFKDLEPTAKEDITVTFSPELLDSWANRPEIVKSIDSKGEVNLKVDDIPDTEKYVSIKQLQYKYGVESSPVFLFQESEIPTEGWLAKFDANDAPFIKIGFDKEYTLSEFKILTGISSKNYTTSSDNEAFYSLLSRPKVITLQFSDGSTQTIELEDDPKEQQVFELVPVLTESVEISVNEVYEGETKGRKVLGIGKIDFGVTNSSAEEEDEVNAIDEEEGENKESILDKAEGNKFFLILCGGFWVIIIIILIIGVVALKRSKKKESIDNKTNLKK